MKLRMLQLVLILVATITSFIVLLEYKKEVIETRPKPRPVQQNDTVKLDYNEYVKLDYDEYESNQYNITKWKLFVGNHSMDDLIHDQPKVFRVNKSRTDAHEQYLKSIDSDFRESISRSVPIHCYSGEYGLFPKKYRKFIDLLVEYSHFHKHQPTTRVLVWKCIKRGFGDRLRGIAFTLALAMFSGRKLFIDWDRDTTLQYLVPNLIDWHISKSEFQNKSRNFNIVDARISKTKWKEFFQQIHGDVPHIVIATNLGLTTLFSDANRKWFKRAHIQAGFNKLSNYEINSVIGFIFRYLFKVDPMIIKEVESAMRVLQINKAPFLGLHLRTGFVGSPTLNENHQKLIKDTSEWMEAFECAVHQADTHIGNNSLIYFATDSNKAKEMAIDKFGLRFRSLDIELIHINNSKGRLDEGIINMLVEMLILSHSYVHIRGLSVFSYISETLCSIPAERVYHGAHYCK